MRRGLGVKSYLSNRGGENDEEMRRVASLSEIVISFFADLAAHLALGAEPAGRAGWDFQQMSRGKTKNKEHGRFGATRPQA